MITRRTGINFHGIGCPQRALEPGEEPYWINVERFEALLDAIALKPESYRISFDDGNLSDYAIALPRLLARGLKADFFVLTGRIGQAGSLGPEEIAALGHAGMGIGSHGKTHRDWCLMDAATLKNELEESKDVLARLSGRPVTAAAIPFGRWNARVLRAMRFAGYEIAWSSDGGRMRQDTFLRPRLSVRADMNVAVFHEVLAGRLGMVQALRRGLGMTFRRLI